MPAQNPSQSMKNLVVFYDGSNNLKTGLQQIPVPLASSLAPNDLLIKVNVAGSNPKDWKHPLPAYFNNKVNQSDDAAGTIAALGSSVRSFTLGERVAGFHRMDELHGCYAEYAICPEQTVFRIPDDMSDEEAATIPLALYTAAVGLYRNLGIPAPWSRSDRSVTGDGSVTSTVPLIVNGASSAVGAYAIKLAKLNALVGPVIAVAGASAEFVKTLDVDAVVDYRSPNVQEQIKKATGGRAVKHVFDASNSLASVKYLVSGGSQAVLANGPDSRYTCTMPVGANPVNGTKGEMEDVLKEAGVWYEQIWVGDVHEQPSASGPIKAGGRLFGGVVSRAVEQLLAEGRLRGHPYEVVEGGLEGVEAALYKLRDRKGGNTKFVTRIRDTVGLGV